ncbi:MAG: AraC family transcriptional regulator, partial [Paenibacillus sp.]|nr:AraC family transcriptional regulator [Paenibacillus sp.]
MFHTMRSITKHKHFFIRLVTYTLLICLRLVTYTLLICLVPIGILGVFFYHSVQNSMHKDIEQANERYLNQTINAMEIVVNQIGNGFRQIVTSSTFIEFDRFPLGNYFDEIDTWYMSDNRQELTDLITSKAKVQRNIETLMQLSDFIYSIYYIHPSRGIVLTSGSLQYEIDRFYDSGWQENLQTNTLRYPTIMNMRYARQLDGSEKRVVPVVFRPLDAKYSVVINLDAEAFYMNLISPLENNGKSSLIIYSSEGEPILYDGDAIKADWISLVRDVITKPENITPTEQSHQVMTDRQLVTWRSSEVLGWKIASVTSLHEIYSNVSNIRNLFLTVSILLAIATAILAIMTSRRMYRPVSHLLQVVKEGYQRESQGNSGKRPKGEFRVISESLADAYETRKRLQLRLRESLPAYQEKFVRSLLKNNAFDAKEIEERFEFLGITLLARGIVPLLIAAESAGSVGESIETEKIVHLLVTDSISEAIEPAHTYWVQELSDDVYLVLLNCGDHEMSVVFASAEAIADNLAAKHNMDCTIGIGTYCVSVAELPRAYGEAEEALQYREMTTGSDIIYIEDVRLHTHYPLPYPKDMEASLIVCLKNGEKDQALVIFAEMVRVMRAQAGKFAFPQVQQAFLLLLMKLIETVRDLHLDMRDIMPEERPNVLAAFLQKEGWLEITNWFEGLIEATAMYIGQAFQEKKNAHVEHAKKL